MNDATGEPTATSRLQVPVHYDFASSLCYVAHRVLGRMANFLDEAGLELEWTPVDLMRLTGWSRGAPVDPVRLQDVRQIARALEVPIQVPEHWLDSRAASAIALHLADQPKREATWRERIFTAIYEESLRPDDLPELQRLGGELEIAASPEAIDSGLRELEVRTEAARKAQVSGVPCFMLGQWPFGGIQDEATMRAVLGRWASRQQRPA
jgi:predicted DsbA family dithiol-disulfide isomerase